MDIKSLWQSRKFRILCLDTVVSVVIFFATHYLAPSAQELVLFLIGSLQPIFLMVVGGIAYEDGQAHAAGLVYGPQGYKPVVDPEDADYPGSDLPY